MADKIEWKLYLLIKTSTSIQNFAQTTLHFLSDIHVNKYLLHAWSAIKILIKWFPESPVSRRSIAKTEYLSLSINRTNDSHALEDTQFFPSRKMSMCSSESVAMSIIAETFSSLSELFDRSSVRTWYGVLRILRGRD